MVRREYPVNATIASYAFLFCLLVFTFYFRGFPIPGISQFGIEVTSSHLIPVLILLSTAYVGGSILLLKFIEFPKQTLILLSLLLFLPLMTIFYNVIVLGNHLVSLLFLIEYILNIGLFWVSFELAKRVDTRRLLLSFVVVGVVYSILLLIWLAIGFESIRRLGTGQVDLPISVNHLGHALAVGIIISLVEIACNRTWRIPFGMAVPVLFATLVLTGSRSSLLGLSFALVIFFLFSTVRGFMLVVSAIIAGLGTLYLLAQTRFEVSAAAWERLLSTDVILADLAYRVGRVADALHLAVSDPAYLVFGIGFDEYQVLGTDELIPDPHNLWMDFVLYLGVPTAIVFTALFLTVSIGLIKLTYLSTREQRTESLMLLLGLIVVSSYVFFSGRMTRIFTIWIMLGLATELIASRSTVHMRFQESQTRLGDSTTQDIEYHHE